jgi:hypothetical protein
MNAAPSWSELDELLAAAARLPVCDSAAKLHALLGRVVQSAQTGSLAADVLPAARALASAATASLAHDPWVQFEAATRAFLQRSSEATPSTEPDSSAAHSQLSDAQSV